ncbi:hypothetical protein VTI28DRAFT_1272 [Corynascus sepedonium]
MKRCVLVHHRSRTTPPITDIHSLIGCLKGSWQGSRTLPFSIKYQVKVPSGSNMFQLTRAQFVRLDTYSREGTHAVEHEYMYFARFPSLSVGIRKPSSSKPPPEPCSNASLKAGAPFCIFFWPNEQLYNACSKSGVFQSVAKTLYAGDICIASGNHPCL